MAIYQFVIELLPNVWAENKESNIDNLYDGDFYDIASAWRCYELTTDIRSFLDGILPKGKSWNEKLEVWGNEERSDIQLRMKKNHILSIKFRLSLQEDVEIIKLKIIALAKILECKLFFPSYRKVIEPDINLLNKSISESRAAKFVNDPEKFLDDLEKN